MTGAGDRCIRGTVIRWSPSIRWATIVAGERRGHSNAGAEIERPRVGVRIVVLPNLRHV